MTMQEAYQQGERKLIGAEVREARLDAWYLLEHVMGISRAGYYAGPDRQLSKEQERQYFGAIERRSRHIPLQHLTGVQEFMGLEFKVSEHVLIPRQDTETAVEEALHIIRQYAKALHPGQGNRCYRVLDMCTGSGCILLSILSYGGRNTTLKLEGTGADVSREALCIARENAQSLQVDAEFLESDLFECVEGTYQMIVSNPPYIRTEAISTLEEEVRLHDPWIALDGKEDGLFFYRRITEAAVMHLEKEGTLIFEIGSDQGEEVAALMHKAGFYNIAVKKDLAGLDRIVTGVYAPGGVYGTGRAER